MVFNNFSTNIKTALFVFSFSLGALAIWFDFHPIVISVSIIIAFTSILFVSPYFLKRENSIPEKNSPYFLGFLFTLFALFNTFIKYETAKIQDLHLFKNLSIALITTIAGLLMRQVLISTDTLPEDEFEALTSLRKLLSESVNDYHSAQIKILKLLDDYSETKKDILKKEKDISKIYTDNLTSSIGIFKKIEKEYPEKIDSLLRHLSTHINNFKSSVEELLPRDIKDDISQRFNTFHKEYLDKLDQGINNFISAMNNISSEMVTSAETEYIATLKTSAKVFDTVHEDYAKSANLHALSIQNSSEKFSSTFERVTSNLEVYQNKIDDFSNGLNKSTEMFNSQITKINNELNANISDFNSSLKKSTDSFSSQIKTFDEGLNARLIQFQREMHSVNELIDSFIDAVGKKLKKINSEI